MMEGYLLKSFKRVIAFILSIVMVLSCAGCTTEKQAKTNAEIAATAAAKWLEKEINIYNLDTNWEIFAFARSGYRELDAHMYTEYETNLEKALSVTNSDIATEDYPSVILTYTAIGKYAETSLGVNLLAGVSLNSSLDEQGVYSTFYALIVVDCAPYEFHEKGDVTRELLVQKIISWQNEDGGFSSNGAGGSSDIRATAVALQALSNYQADGEVNAVIQNALDYLENEQLPAGGYGSAGNVSIQETAQVIIALTELDISPDEFGNGKIIQDILAYQNENGSFACTGETDYDATLQALLALTAYNRFISGATSLFDLTDVYGITHNKLVGSMKVVSNIMFGLFGLIILFLVYVFIQSRIRISKWRKEGIYNEETKRMMTNEEAEEYHKRKNSEAIQEEKENE